MQVILGRMNSAALARSFQRLADGQSPDYGSKAVHIKGLRVLFRLSRLPKR